MKRVLIFSLVYYPRYIGGAELSVKEITDRIDSSEIQFDMITLRKGDKAFERVGNVNVHRVGMPFISSSFGDPNISIFSKYLYIFLAFIKALSLHRKKPYDAIWSIMANYAGFSALFFKKVHPEVPYLLTLQEGDPIEKIKERVGIFFFLFKKIFTKADHVQAISTFLADWARSMGVTTSIDVIANGVDFEKFSKPVSYADREAIRSECGFNKDDIVVVTTSRLVEKNAVDDVISSMEYLNSSYKLLIVGSGKDEDYLRQLVSDKALDTKVFFRGFINHDRLLLYLGSSDIFVRPSRSEGLGNSFLEAMAAGIPVIATPVGGIPDFLVEGETGLFCEINNPESIKNQIMRLSGDRTLRDKIVNNARNMVKIRYSWDEISKALTSIFAALTTNPETEKVQVEKNDKRKGYVEPTPDEVDIDLDK